MKNKKVDKWKVSNKNYMKLKCMKIIIEKDVINLITNSPTWINKEG